MSRFKVVAVACLGTVAVAAAAQPSLSQPGPGQTGLRKITVDASTTVGTVRSLQGVDGAPGPGGHKPENFTFGGWNMRESVDASAGYRLARIDLVRTHDGYGPGDIDARFETAQAPGGALISAKRDAFTLFPNPAADPDNPASYRFEPTDRLVGAIKKIGAEVLFRLGRSEGADPTPPSDFARYAAIVKHVVLHYNRGWANGFHYNMKRTRTRWSAHRRLQSRMTTHPIAMSSCARRAPLTPRSTFIPGTGTRPIPTIRATSTGSRKSCASAWTTSA